MEDRLTPGAVAGAAGAFAQIIYGLIIKGFHISPYVFTDFGKILIMGKPWAGLMAYFVGAVTHMLMGAAFGVLFSYIIKYTTKRFYLLKGWGVGLFAFTFAGGTGTYFKMPVFNTLPPWPAIVIMVGSTIYGLTTAITLKLVTDNFSRFFTENEVYAKHEQSLMRYHLAPTPARKIKLQ